MNLIKIIFLFLTNFNFISCFWTTGFTYLSSDWISVTTGRGFTSDNVIVILGIPQFTSVQNLTIVPRLQNLPVYNSDNTITFTAKLTTDCTESIPFGRVPYIVMDKDSIKLGGYTFLAGTYRFYAQPVTTPNEVNFPSDTFSLTDKLGAIGQIMTINNGDLFLSLRLQSITYQKSSWTFHTPTDIAETIGYLVFNALPSDSSQIFSSIYCNSGIEIEAFKLPTFSRYPAQTIISGGSYQQSPGVFGLVGFKANTALTPAIESITNYNQITLSGKTSKCNADKHTTETFYGLIIGKSNYYGNPDYNDNFCNGNFDANYTTPTPTFPPTFAPTFTDSRKLIYYGLNQSSVRQYSDKKNRGYYGYVHDFSGDGKRLAVGCKSCGIAKDSLAPGAAYLFSYQIDQWKSCLSNRIDPPIDRKGEFITLGFGASLSISDDATILAVASISVNPDAAFEFRGVVLYRDRSANCTLVPFQRFNLFSLVSIDSSENYDNNFYVELSGNGKVLAIGIPVYNDGKGIVLLYKMQSNGFFNSYQNYTALPISSTNLSPNSLGYGKYMSINYDGTILVVGNDGYSLDIGTNYINGRVEVFQTENPSRAPVFVFGYKTTTADTKLLGESIAISGDGKSLIFGNPSIGVVSGGASVGQIYVAPLDKILANSGTLGCSESSFFTSCCTSYPTYDENAISCAMIKRKAGENNYDRFGSAVHINYDGSIIAVATKRAASKTDYKINNLRILSTSQLLPGYPDLYYQIDSTPYKTDSQSIHPVLSNDGKYISLSQITGQATTSGLVTVYTYAETSSPTIVPSTSPSKSPIAPTTRPSRSPTYSPSVSPTFEPSVSPTFSPSRSPTFQPTFEPSISPTRPTAEPTYFPTLAAGLTYPPSRSPSFSPSSKPTFKPSSKPSISPTSKPSIIPSSSPTSKPSTKPSEIPTFKPTFQPSTSTPTIECKKTCLDVSLVDLYGDGWDTAELYISDGPGNVVRYFPTCTKNSQCIELCPDDNGGDVLYRMELSNPNKSYIPKNNWEIVWNVTIANSTQSSYQGGYGTKMSWSYDSAVCEWNLEIINGTQPKYHKCSSDICPPPPPPKKKPNNKKEKKPETDDLKNTTKTKPKYGPPAVNLQVRLLINETINDNNDNNCGGKIIPSWYLADNTRETLFHSGILCEGNIEYCSMCLGDGSYTIRFIGGLLNSTNVKWDFCGVTDYAPSELTFHVKKGECYPDVITSPCSSTTIQSLIKLSGDLLITGYSHQQFQTSDLMKITNYIQNTIIGWESFQINSIILDENDSSNNKNKNSNKNNKNKNIIKSGSNDDNNNENNKNKNNKRRLLEFNYRLEYTVEFIIEEKYPSYDGKDYSSIQSLVESLENTLSTTFSSFTTYNNEYNLSPGLFSTFNSQELYEIIPKKVIIEDVTYIGLPPLQSSNLADPDWSIYYANTNTKSSTSSSSITTAIWNNLLSQSYESLFISVLVVIIIGSVIALLVAMTITKNSKNNNEIYSKNESRDYSDFDSSSSNLTINFTDMDNTISPLQNSISNRNEQSIDYRAQNML